MATRFKISKEDMVAHLPITAPVAQLPSANSLASSSSPTSSSPDSSSLAGDPSHSSRDLSILKECSSPHNITTGTSIRICAPSVVIPNTNLVSAVLPPGISASSVTRMVISLTVVGPKPNLSREMFTWLKQKNTINRKNFHPLRSITSKQQTQKRNLRRDFMPTCLLFLNNITKEDLTSEQDLTLQQKST